MTNVYIGLGSNIEPEKNIKIALTLLGEKVDIIQISDFFWSKPVGEGVGENLFINGAVLIHTNRSSLNLKNEVLRKIENDLERKRFHYKNAPRTIDLDILLFGGDMIDSQNLKIPDPNILKFNFLYIPLLQLTPELINPVTQKKYCDSIKMHHDDLERIVL